MCARNDHGSGVSPNPGLGSWLDSDVKLAFSTDLPNLNKVYFCGTHGDPLASDCLFECIRYCKSRNVDIEIFTNGSLRSAKWWNDLVSMLTPNDKIVFGVDGIKTNHLYRQNTNIDKILSNMEICCNSPVTVQWDFLAFRHNEHELDECRDVAKRLGVDRFRIRKTARWNMSQGNRYPVKNANGDITHYLEPPINPDLVHPDIDKITDMAHKPLDGYKIECIYREARKMYINSRMEVFPCCYISSDNEELRINRKSDSLHVPFNEFNLREKTWREIFDHRFYKDDLVNSFTGTNTITRCIKTCGLIKRESNQNEMKQI